MYGEKASRAFWSIAFVRMYGGRLEREGVVGLCAVHMGWRFFPALVMWVGLAGVRGLKGWILCICGWVAYSVVHFAVR